MKKKKLSALFITAFVFSILSGAINVKATTYTFGQSSETYDSSYVGILFILSPTNRTYKPGALTLNVSCDGGIGGGDNVTMSYVLDDGQNVTFPVTVGPRKSFLFVS